MRSYIVLQNTQRDELPQEFRDDDVRYPESLVRHFVQAFTQEGGVVLDPFAGYGTTLRAAEEMGRIAYGVEFDECRVQYARPRLRNPQRLICGDSRQIASYDLPPFDLSITSPPFMGRHDTENPFTAYTSEGSYDAYLQDMRDIYAQVRRLMKPGAHVVIEVANLKLADDLTTLAWDVAEVVSNVLHFEGEVIVGWDRYGYGYDHSYCLIFAGQWRAMDLQLAVAVSCSEARCRVQLLDSPLTIDAQRSEPMVAHKIEVRPGQLVAVDRGADLPQIVYRWPSIEAQQVKSGFTLVQEGKAVDPDRLRAEAFPPIQAMYGRMEEPGAIDPKQVVEQGYDRIAERYLALARSEAQDGSTARARHTSLLLERLPPGARVLDLGCGAGVPTAQALAQRCQVIGVDLSAGQIALARQNVPQALFIRADVTQLDFAAGSFDAVVAFWSLIHVPRGEQPKLLRDIATWLRPGGLFVASLGTHPMAADLDDYLGAAMYWSGFDSETNKRLVEEAGLRLLRAQEETQVELGEPVTWLWVVAQKPGVRD